MATEQDEHILKFSKLKKALQIDLGGAPFRVELTEKNVVRALERVRSTEPQAADAIARYYGIGMSDALTMPQIADSLGVKRQAVFLTINKGRGLLAERIMSDWRESLLSMFSTAFDLDDNQVQILLRAVYRNAPIDVLNLKPRTRNALSDENRTINDLIKKGRAEIKQRTPNFGDTSLQDLVDALLEIGIRLPD